MHVLAQATPSAGEIWIEELDGPSDGRRFVAWRLLDTTQSPLGRNALEAAAQRLLCNPAIEKALIAT